MNTKQLKSKILDLAIHGKLVPQNPNDESASKLLEKIREEKQKLIAEKKIKADKNDSYIFVGDDNRHYEKFADGTVKDIEDEIPFEVPEGWEWCRLKNICLEFIVPQRDKPTTFDGNIPWCRIEDIEGKYLNGSLSNQLVSMETIKKMNMHICPKGSIICSCSASLGVQAIVTVDCCTNQTFIGIVPKHEVLFNEYLYYFLGAQTKYFNEIATGTTIKYISRDKFENLLFPLPPIMEQEKTVSAIEHYFSLINAIENDKSDLQTAIKQAKFKILDLAIHGKLVPQDSSDEPASVLLERLRAEKEAKIKAGELKRDKNDSYIYKNTTDNCYYQKFVDGSETDISDEIPFEIPDNWNWCNLGEIYSHTTGKALKKENNKGTLRKYITTSNLYWNSFDFTDVRTMYFTDDELEKCTIKKGDLVLCNGGDVGRAAIWKLDEDICYQNHISRLRPKLSGINNSFYLYVIQINKEKGNLSGKGVGITSLSATDILNLKIPLPPLAEQKRIVEKIENAFAKLDQIAEQLA